MKTEDKLTLKTKQMTWKQKLDLIVIKLVSLILATSVVVLAWNTFIVYIFPTMPETSFLETFVFAGIWFVGFQFANINRG